VSGNACIYWTSGTHTGHYSASSLRPRRSIFLARRNATVCAIGRDGINVRWCRARIGKINTFRDHHSSPRTTKLYELRKEEISLDEVERPASNRVDNSCC
jgi:hypothetical protein